MSLRLSLFFVLHNVKVNIFTYYACFPGESLEKGIQKSYVLAKDEAIILQATEAFTEIPSPGKKRGQNSNTTQEQCGAVVSACDLLYG